MRKDKLISFRVPEEVQRQLRSFAEAEGITVSELMKRTITGMNWKVELGRNREYHQLMLKRIDEVERTLSKKSRQATKRRTKVKE